MTSIIIRCDVGPEIGLGHYSRCALLKDALKKNGVDACLALKYQGDHIVSLSADILIEGSYSEEISKYGFEAKNIILDILHCKNSNKSEVAEYVSNLKQANNKIALIEGLEDDACPVSLFPFLDALFTPYIQVKSRKELLNHFFGKDFLMLDPTRALIYKEIKEPANKVLLTFGGSDPWDQTLRLLNELRKDKRSNNLEFMIVIGPLMSQNQIDSILPYQAYFKMQLVYSLKDLTECFNWADLAITNTGQTRYELASSGIPFIILAFDDGGYYKSLVFQELEVAYLARQFDVSRKDFYIEKIFSILNCKETRLKMSLNGKRNFYNTLSINNFSETLIGVFK